LPQRAAGKRRRRLLRRGADVDPHAADIVRRMAERIVAAGASASAAKLGRRAVRRQTLEFATRELMLQRPV
jgi:hypothetical protein